MPPIEVNPKFSANLSMMFQELPFLERFSAAAESGFKAVEFMFPYDYSIAELQRELVNNDLNLILFNMPAGDISAGERGIARIRRGPGPDHLVGRVLLGAFILSIQTLGTPAAGSDQRPRLVPDQPRPGRNQPFRRSLRGGIPAPIHALS